ncbi:hypothetical protein WUBG_07590, partial [Wuchereria bancrofti]
VVICQSSLELRRYIGPDCLTMDVGGVLKYNHLEWVQHRMVTCFLFYCHYYYYHCYYYHLLLSLLLNYYCYCYYYY